MGDIDWTVLVLYVCSWLAFGGLIVALGAALGGRYRKRRQTHYEDNPDPLFGKPE